MESIGNCWAETHRLGREIAKADAVMVGVGAGLSAAAGLTYSGERFQRYFADFEKKYGITDMYTGGFYSYATLEEYWAWWSRQILVNRYDQSAGKPYRDLLALLKGKTILLSPPMWITSSSWRASINSGCFTPRGITAFGNAPNPVTRKPTTMKARSAAWRLTSGRCGFPPS